jgi:NAD(P)-dependent dehydrogenase (short-subunit alcohol dehydrogenase family)
MTSSTVLSPQALRGRAILVTGATSGIGAETARLAASLGAVVAVHGRDVQRAEATAASLDGADHAVVLADLATDDPAEVVKAAVRKVGPLSGFVHAAGLHSSKPLRALRDTDFDHLFRVNVTAAALLMKAMRMPVNRAESVSVVLVSSVAGVVGQAGVSAYAASKGAVVALTKSLSVELAGEGIRINCVVPGMVPTPMSTALMSRLSPEQQGSVAAEHPLGLGAVEDVAWPIVFLLSDGSRWMTGSTLTADGGFTAR